MNSEMNLLSTVENDGPDSAGTEPATAIPPRIDVPPWLEVTTLVLLATAAVIGAQIAGPTTATGNSVAAAGLFGGLVLVLLFRWLKGDAWSSLGLGRPESWRRTLLLAVAATAVLKVAGLFALNVLTPLLGGETPDLSRFAALKGNLPMLLGTLASVWITAAFIEEVIYRGFLMGRLARIFGGSRGAWLAALALSSVLFGLLHVYQGLPGVIVTGFMGFLLGGVYLLAGRNLWVVILAHGLTNTISLLLVYYGFEL
jgi:membrane protease YdiL (CAAX protease family)